MWQKKRALPPDWGKTRQLILRRDGYRCTFVDQYGDRCHAGERLEVNHKVDNSDHSPSNLETLCHWHHTFVTAKQSADAKAKHQAEISNLFRRSEPHPSDR